MSQFDINKIKKSMEKIEKKLREIPQLKKLQKTIGMPLVPLFIAAFALVVFLIYLFSGLRAITNLVAFVYPAYMTIKALGSENKDDDTLWLAYWLFYGLFSVVESVTDVLFFWIPMYELVKMVFFIYLYAPQLQGAVFLYNKAIKPLTPRLEAFEKTIAKSLGSVNSVFQEATSATKTSGATNASKKN